MTLSAFAPLSVVTFTLVVLYMRRTCTKITLAMSPCYMTTDERSGPPHCSFKNSSRWPCPMDPHSTHHTFGSRAAHPTTSPIILPRGNTALVRWWDRPPTQHQQVTNLQFFMWHEESLDIKVKRRTKSGRPLGNPRTWYDKATYWGEQAVCDDLIPPVIVAKIEQYRLT